MLICQDCEKVMKFERSGFENVDIFRCIFGFDNIDTITKCSQFKAKPKSKDKGLTKKGTQTEGRIKKTEGINKNAQLGMR